MMKLTFFKTHIITRYPCIVIFILSLHLSVFIIVCLKKNEDALDCFPLARMTLDYSRRWS
jgi:hypothetical protein